MSIIRQQAMVALLKAQPNGGPTLAEIDAYELGYKSRDKEVDDLVEWVRTAKIQLEYLNGKFTATGSTNAVLSSLETFLTKYPQ